MTTKQREQHLQRFASASIADVALPDRVAGSITEMSVCLGRDQTLPLLLSVDVNTVADGVRVPRNSLEGIWSKAVELLKTEGAIVSAPGVGDGAKFVLSYRGRNPHLVVPRKGGAFACDGNCPNWKALNICAHSVAAAELCSKLPEFVAWFRKANKCPDPSKFAEATMPKGRGKKGNENPRKRKTSAATETIIENPFTATISMSLHGSSPPLGYDTATIPMSLHGSSPPLGYDNPQLHATCSVPFAMSQTNTLQWPYPYPYEPMDRCHHPNKAMLHLLHSPFVKYQEILVSVLAAGTNTPKNLIPQTTCAYSTKNGVNILGLERLQQLID